AAEKAIAARTQVMSEAVTFNDLSYSDGVISSVFESRDASGRLLGFAIETAANGFGGPIRQIVGVKVDSENGNYTLQVSGVAILDMSDETPGVGSKANTSTFLGQFAGMNSAGLAADYDAVSGATYSSEGVRAGVEAALAIATQIIQESGGTVQ
ncbi:MAG: FMN-binding protein, partial [Clostridia bacterium]|nr:FMN-binding protein [Clostridia bacterium]